MAIATDACRKGHFVPQWAIFFIEPYIFVSNNVFLCRTMYFYVEPGFLVSNKCYD